MTKNMNRRVFFRIYDEVNLSCEKIDNQWLTEPTPFADNRLHNDSLPVELLRKSGDAAFLINTNDTCNINISASGIAFNCDQALEAGDYLLIKLQLVSTGAVVVACAKVVYCRSSQVPDDEYPYLLGAHFVTMADKDRELLINHVAKHRSQQNRFRLILLATAIAVVLVPDLVFGTLYSLLHFLAVYLLEFIHIVFEFLEVALDDVIEHLFHTELHETQVIVFYILAFLFLAGLYALWRILPPFCRKCKHHQIIYWSRKKANLLLYWREQPLFEKIKMVTIGLAAIIFYISFGM
jgi:hypothetical protein